MAKGKTPVEYKLNKLQRTVRHKQQPTEGSAYFAVVPDDLQAGERLSLTRQEYRQMRGAIAELENDIRFEHLFKRRPRGGVDSRAAERAVWRFICLAYYRSGEDHVAGFVTEHAREPQSSRCYFAVSDLVVEERFQAGGATFLPHSDEEIPEARSFTFPSPGTTAIVAADVLGTGFSFMVERARAVAEHAARLLRVGLRRHRAVTAEQLRFRVGHVYAVSSGGAGWSKPDDATFQLGLDEGLRQLFSEQPLSGLPADASGDIEARALVALGWFDRARLTGEPLIATLYNFFGLEALLGDRSEELKGPLIAFRRAVLAIETTGHTRHPAVMGWLYEQIRSAAVHGQEPPEIALNEHGAFNWDAWQALNDFLEIAASRQFASRGELLLFLDRSEQGKRLLDSLRREDSQWSRFTPPGLRDDRG